MTQEIEKSRYQTFRFAMIVGSIHGSLFKCPFQYCICIYMYIGCRYANLILSNGAVLLDRRLKDPVQCLIRQINIWPWHKTWEKHGHYSTIYFVKQLSIKPRDKHYNEEPSPSFPLRTHITLFSFFFFFLYHKMVRFS